MRREAGKRQGFWIAVLVATLFYTLFALPPAGKEPQLQALGALSLPEPREIKEPLDPVKAGWAAFASLDSFGFFSPGEGVVESCWRLGPLAACDGRYLVNPLPERDVTEIRKLHEGRKIEIPFTGYPFMESSRIFLVRQDQQGVSEIDSDGKSLWTREFGSILTSASATAGHSVWGTLGGEIVVQKGMEDFRAIEAPSFGVNSEKACVFSVAVSSDGSMIALLYGLDPQYALFLELKGGAYNLVHKVKLESQTTRAESAAFSLDGTFAILRTAVGLLIFNAKERSSRLVQPVRFGGTTEVSMKAWGDESVVLLSSSRNGKHISIVRKGILEAYFKVDDDATGVSAQDAESLAVSSRNSITWYGRGERTE